MKFDHVPVPALRPSEYTAALIQALQGMASKIKGANVLEIGSGSGVVLAALGALGARSLCGVDIEHAAVTVGTGLLGDLGYRESAELHHGDMWGPVPGRRFDMIVANLPHFPMEVRELPGRLPTWSAGGPDGRALLDPFLEGLGRHLAPGGRAVITHNGFVGLEHSRALLRHLSLALRVLATTFIYIPDEKLDLMTEAIRCAEDGRSLHRYGPYTFGEMHIVEIAGAGTSG
jgi:release factor glutamine methyltransferase